MKVSLSVAWEQVLDVSAGANIQHAATNVTDRDTFISWTRLFAHLPIQRTKSAKIFRRGAPPYALLYFGFTFFP